MKPKARVFYQNTSSWTRATLYQYCFLVIYLNTKGRIEWWDQQHIYQIMENIKLCPIRLRANSGTIR